MEKLNVARRKCSTSHTKYCTTLIECNTFYARQFLRPGYHTEKFQNFANLYTQKQWFTCFPQNRCFEKIGKTHKKTTAMDPFLVNINRKRTSL